MLYHVPDREKALSEIRPVLRPTCRFYAATSGENHLGELLDLVDRFAGKRVDGPRFATTFTLENGSGQIERFFSHVALFRYDDALVVTEAEPLIAYILFGLGKSHLEGDRLSALERGAVTLDRRTIDPPVVPPSTGGPSFPLR